MQEYLDKIEIEQDGKRHELRIPQPVAPPTPDETERELMRRYLGSIGPVNYMKEAFPGSSLRDCVEADLYRIAYMDSGTAPTPMLLYADGLAGANAIGWNDTDRRYDRNTDKTVYINGLDISGIKRTQGLFSQEKVNGWNRFTNLRHLSVRLYNQNATAADITYLASYSKHLKEAYMYLGGSLTGSYAFQYCTELRQVSCNPISSTPPRMNAYCMFKGCKNLWSANMRGIRLTNVYDMFKDTGIQSASLDFREVERPGDAFPGRTHFEEMYICGLGTPAACTTINFGSISAWRKAALLETLGDTHDRAKAGYTACTLTLHRNLSTYPPENLKAELSQKGYTLVFR